MKNMEQGYIMNHYISYTRLTMGLAFWLHWVVRGVNTCQYICIPAFHIQGVYGYVLQCFTLVASQAKKAIIQWV